MKNFLFLIALTLIISNCSEEKSKNQEHNHVEKSEEKSEQNKKKPLSPHTSTMAMVGDAHIHIDYSSPSVRGRIIFGGLLPYDEVWQAGAHMATWIETNKDLTIEGQVLPAGKYGFFTIPSKEEWTVIFNSNWDQHGKDDYDESLNVLSLKVKPEALQDLVENLEYKITSIDADNGTVSLAWEKVSISFNFEVN